MNEMLQPPPLDVAQIGFTPLAIPTLSPLPPPPPPLVSTRNLAPLSFIPPHICILYKSTQLYTTAHGGRILGILREETYSEEWCTIYEEDRLLFFPLSLSLFFSSLIILLLYLPLHRSITPLPRGLFLENGKRVRSLLPLAKRDLI